MIPTANSIAQGGALEKRNATIESGFGVRNLRRAILDVAVLQVAALFSLAISLLIAASSASFHSISAPAVTPLTIYF